MSENKATIIINQKGNAAMHFPFVIHYIILE